MQVLTFTHVHASAHIISGLIIALLEAAPTLICHCLQPLLPHPAVPLHSRHAQRLLNAPLGGGPGRGTRLRVLKTDIEDLDVTREEGDASCLGIG
jgi:hypothetical protein